jgi:hypothetical protein
MAIILAVPARAELADVPSLTISQLKITSSNGQFVTLYNPGDKTIDMSKYQLEYFNSFDAAKATSSRLIGLSGTLQPHGYYMINDSSQLLCYQITVDSVSLGFSSTAGLVELLSLSQLTSGGPVTPKLEDYAGWSKANAPDAQTLPASTNAFLQRLAPIGSATIQSPGSGSWQVVQPDPMNPCSLVTAIPSDPAAGTHPPDMQLLPGIEPPAIINPTADTVPDAGTTQAGEGASNGAMAPLITEILPNPAGTGNDSVGEFIELYNPNSSLFSLSGFTLQSGTASLHNYVFPVGAGIPANGFAVFYSLTTGLSMSNASGQVRLLSPAGSPIAATDAYADAKDGQAWALAGGRWQWTVRPTPGSTNIISAPPAKSNSRAVSTKSGTKKSAGSVKGVSTKTKTKKIKTGTGALATAPSSAESSAPLHTWVLVSVGSLAVLYGAYEYRADLANRIYELRRYIGARRKNRQ